MALVVTGGVYAGPADAPQPYDGVWGATARGCHDPEGVYKLGIKGGDFAWYETFCRTRSVQAGLNRTWKLRVACQGEGEHFNAKPRIALPSPDRLILYDAPVTPTKRQTYVRRAEPATGKR